MSRKFTIESLENRTLLSSAGINYPNFSSTANLVGNGFGAGAVTSANKLQLTSGQNYQARSVFYDSAVPIEKFRTDFTFQIDKNPVGADGLTFVIQTGSTSFLGSDGRDLGYGRTSARSEAIAFDQYNFYEYGSKFGFASNGQKPGTTQPMGALDLHSGHAFAVTATYDGKILRVSVTDTTDHTKVFGASQRIDLVKALGSNTAFIGFTAATGANRSTQDVLNWSYNGSNSDGVSAPTPAPTAPAFATAAHGTPARVTGTSTTLSALGTDQADAERNLIYKWRVTSMPAGAVAPTFSKNSSNAAKNTLAHFAKDGTYIFRCTVMNSAGLSASSSVTVRVVQSATSIALTPHRVDLKTSQRVQFGATELDQFNHAMRVQPTFRFGLESGDGTINARTGMYVAPADVTHAIVDATADNLVGVVGLTVKPKDIPPVVSA